MVSLLANPYQYQWHSKAESILSTSASFHQLGWLNIIPGNAMLTQVLVTISCHLLSKHALLRLDQSPAASGRGWMLVQAPGLACHQNLQILTCTADEASCG